MDTVGRVDYPRDGVRKVAHGLLGFPATKQPICPVVGILIPPTSKGLSTPENWLLVTREILRKQGDV